jgi:hypothetical protein
MRYKSEAPNVVVAAEIQHPAICVSVICGQLMVGLCVCVCVCV